MNSKSLKTLEYTKIIERLTEYASSPLGKEKCQKHICLQTIKFVFCLSFS